MSKQETHPTWQTNVFIWIDHRDGTSHSKTLGQSLDALRQENIENALVLHELPATLRSLARDIEKAIAARQKESEPEIRCRRCGKAALTGQALCEECGQVL